MSQVLREAWLFLLWWGEGVRQAGRRFFVWGMMVAACPTPTDGWDLGLVKRGKRGYKEEGEDGE
ncbi:MAG: hypothetical protein WAM60_27210 [Candidatus Promineifilaceae bacterium]